MFSHRVESAVVSKWSEEIIAGHGRRAGGEMGAGEGAGGEHREMIGRDNQYTK